MAQQQIGRGKRENTYVNKETNKFTKLNTTQ